MAKVWRSAALAIREFGTDFGRVASVKSISQMHHAFAALVAELADRGIRFAVCGSLAIAAYGFPRFARDIDFLVDLAPGHVERLAAALGDEFVVVASTLIHVASIQKFDLHSVGADRFRAAAIERSRPMEVDLFGTSVTFPLVSAEDSILAKLVRFNDEEWQRDILGAVAVQGDKLDRVYMSATAAELGLTDELNQLFD